MNALSSIATQLVVEDGLRRDHLGEFADGPAWRMLLELYRSGEQFQKCVTGASLAPYATAHRILAQLETAGLATSRDDPDDGRRRVVALTAKGWSAVNQSLSEIERERQAA